MTTEEAIKELEKWRKGWALCQKATPSTSLSRCVEMSDAILTELARVTAERDQLKEMLMNSQPGGHIRITTLEETKRWAIGLATR